MHFKNGSYADAMQLEVLAVGRVLVDVRVWRGKRDRRHEVLFGRRHTVVEHL